MKGVQENFWGDDENVLHVNCDVATWVLRRFSKLIELDT